MTTLRVLALLAIVLTLGLVIAFIWRPPDDLNGRTKLVWVSDDNPARTEQIAGFTNANPADKLVLDPSGMGTEKILLQCSSGVGPDLFDIYSVGDLQTYVEAGVLADITDDAAQLGIGPHSSWPSLAGEITYAGRQYCYPCNIGTRLVVYNKNVFDYYGIPYPPKIETWPDLFQLGLKVSTIGTGKTSPAGPIYGIAQLDWTSFFASEHGEYFDPQGHLWILNNPALKRAFATHRDLVFKYRLTPTSIELGSMGGQGGWGNASLTQFAANRFAMIVTGDFSLIAFGRNYREQIDELRASGKKAADIQNPLDRPLRLGSFLLPAFPGDPPCCEFDSRNAGINAASPHRREALAFLKYLASPAYAAIVNRTFNNLSGNNKYVDLDAPTQPSDLDEAGLHRTSVQAMAFGYTKRMSPYILQREVEGVLGGEIGRLESDPSLNLDALLQDAQRQLSRLLQRNLDHDPALKKLYQQSLADHPVNGTPPP